MITDRSGRQEVLLPIDHNYNEIYDNLGFFKSKHKKFREFFFGGRVKKKPFKWLMRACDGPYCPINLRMTRTVLLVLKSQ